MQTFHTCRFKGCPYTDNTIWLHHDEIRYGKRHYMHTACYVNSEQPLEKLSDAELETLPYFVLKAAGKLAYVEKRLKKTVKP